MTIVKRNIIANFFGKVWSASINLLLVPVYIKLLGIESYGLIGFYATLIGSFAILDLGLSTTLNRELARAKATNEEPHKVRNLVFTVECIYWCMGLLIAVIIVSLAPFIGGHWIKSEGIPRNVVVHSVMLMGAVIAFQWPINIYIGGLLGLEKQVIYNVVLVVMTTLRSAGVLVLFIWVKPTVVLFFLWQAGVYLLHVITIRAMLWNYLPDSNQPRHFSKPEIKRIQKFAFGVMGHGASSFLLTQIDKIFLSVMLPLTLYGYYILSYTVGTALLMLITPVVTASFPRFVAFASSNDKPQLIHSYHTNCKVVASFTFPIALLLIFFTKDILFIWTKNLETVEQITKMVQIITIGTMFNCLVQIQFVLLFAYGNVRFLVKQNIIACIVLIPTLFFLIKQFGVFGATLVWLSLNAGFLVASTIMIHKLYLKGEFRQWLLYDTFLPLLPALFMILAAKLIVLNFFAQVPLNLFSMGTIAGTVIFLTMFFYVSPKKVFYYIANFKRIKLYR